MRAALLAIGLCVCSASSAVAEETFRLTGLHYDNPPPATITLTHGAELTPCTEGNDGMQRCVLVSTNVATAATDAIVEQLRTQGFAQTPVPQNALPGMIALLPAAPRAQCPQVILITPGLERQYATAPAPADKTFLTFSYVADTCTLGWRTQ